MIESLTIPAMYIGTADAQLTVEPDPYGDTYRMALIAADGHVIAAAEGFRPGAARDFGADLYTAQTFGAFLSHALEDSEFGAEWSLADDASDWADALTLMGETE